MEIQQVGEIGSEHHVVAVVMGSRSDYGVMSASAALLEELKIGYKLLLISAHRTPQRLFDFAKNAKSNNYKVIIAGAGGAAHLPGMIASMTSLPVLGVPIDITPMNGLDSMLSIVQMPRGCPVATFAISSSAEFSPGAVNAAVFAAEILALSDQDVESRLKEWKEKQVDIGESLP